VASGEEGAGALVGYTTLELFGSKVSPATGKLGRTPAIEYAGRNGNVGALSERKGASGIKSAANSEPGCKSKDANMLVEQIFAAMTGNLWGWWELCEKSITGCWGATESFEFTPKTSKGSRVYVIPGQSVALGAFQLTSSAKELHYPLTWAENGRLVAELVDLSGHRVTASYPRARIYSENVFSHITLLSPRKGIWKAVSRVFSVFPKEVHYYRVVSARTGGSGIPYEASEICIFDDICIPLPDLPTWLLGGISLAVLP